MIIEQIYTGCLAQGAYYVQSGREVAIIDPLREVEPYIKRAKAAGAIIKYVFETHFHADFVSGHLDLARQTGATIIYGPNAEPKFRAYIATDDQEFKLGKVTFKVLHTPGHTLESACYLLFDHDGEQKALFSGDTLFIDDVGRPDLAQKAAHITREEMAGTLFDSLRNKIMPLNDDIIIYPAHGAGSACGKNMSNKTADTLGNQKKHNYALRATMTRNEFINEVTNGLMPPPAYFPMNVKMNRDGYTNVEEVLSKGTRALSAGEFEAAVNHNDAIILDTRAADVFTDDFIPKAINIGIDGNFAPWVGALVTNAKQDILLVTDEGREEEVVTRLARIGYDNAIGYLKGGINAWKSAGYETDYITSVTANEFAPQIQTGKLCNILDVRTINEYASEHLIDAENIPLYDLNDNMNRIDKNTTYYVHCAGGYRSMIFISILKARGYNNLVNVPGGFKALQQTGRFNISPYVCPSITV